MPSKPARLTGVGTLLAGFATESPSTARSAASFARASASGSGTSSCPLWRGETLVGKSAGACADTGPVSLPTKVRMGSTIKKIDIAFDRPFTLPIPSGSPWAIRLLARLAGCYCAFGYVSALHRDRHGCRYVAFQYHLDSCARTPPITARATAAAIKRTRVRDGTRS